MDINFYNTASPPNMLNKKLTFKYGTSVARNTSEVDILNPVLIMEYKEMYLQDVNYMYIGEFGRYYFCRTEVLTGGAVKIYGKVDVLMTYRNEINNVYTTVYKQAVNKNLYLPQTQPILCYPITSTKKFAKSFNDNYDYVLITCGGGE